MERASESLPTSPIHYIQLLTTSACVCVCVCLFMDGRRTDLQILEGYSCHLMLGTLLFFKARSEVIVSPFFLKGLPCTLLAHPFRPQLGPRSPPDCAIQVPSHLRPGSLRSCSCVGCWWVGKRKRERAVLLVQWYFETQAEFLQEILSSTLHIPGPTLPFR